MDPDRHHQIQCTSPIGIGLVACAAHEVGSPVRVPRVQLEPSECVDAASKPHASTVASDRADADIAPESHVAAGRKRNARSDFCGSRGSDDHVRAKFGLRAGVVGLRASNGRGYEHGETNRCSDALSATRHRTCVSSPVPAKTTHDGIMVGIAGSLANRVAPSQP